MIRNLGLKALAGAVALALGGNALANTTFDPASADSHLFLNIVDSTTQTSYLFDTGLTQSSVISSLNTFNYSSGSLASDSNYTSFLASIGAGDSVDYSVISTSKIGTVGKALFTSNLGSVAKATGSNLNQGLTVGTNFQNGANAVTSSSTTSVKLDNTNSWIAAPLLAEGTFGQKLLGNTTGTQGAIGTAMSFYYETSSQLNSFSNTATTLAQAAGQWLLSNDTLTFSSPTSQVPLPAGLPLLLSGLAAMGLFGRRSKGGALQAAV